MSPDMRCLFIYRYDGRENKQTAAEGSHSHPWIPCVCPPNVRCQEILDGKTSFLGQGYWREVRLAEYKGQEVAVKTLRNTHNESARNKERHRWEAVALDMVRLLP